MGIKGYEDLKVWHKARALVKDIYLASESFPQKETYRLTDQLCRAAISVAANIAEGSARRSTREYIRFINIAYSSLAECETHLHIAHDLGYLTNDQIGDLLDKSSEVGKMLNALYNALKKKLQDTDHRILDTEAS